jgi:hypothetical protein
MLYQLSYSRVATSFLPRRARGVKPFPGQAARPGRGEAPVARAAGASITSDPERVYLSAPTRFFTAATDLSIIACSVASSLNSRTFSRPFAPMTHGTPT